MLNDDNAGKPEGIHLMIGRRPYAAFRQLDRRPANAGIHQGGRRRAAVDDRAARRCQREYAYGPAQDFPDTKVGTFTQALYDEAKKDGWTVISMKNDWKRIFAFE